MLKFSNTQNPKYSHAHILAYSNTQMLKYSNTQILKYSNTQILKYSHTHILKRQNPGPGQPKTLEPLTKSFSGLKLKPLNKKAFRIWPTGPNGQKPLTKKLLPLNKETFAKMPILGPSERFFVKDLRVLGCPGPGFWRLRAFWAAQGPQNPGKFFC